MVFALANTGASLVIPLLIKELMDTINSGLSKQMIAVLIGLFIIQMITSALSLYLLAQVGQGVVEKLRTTIWDKLVKLPVSFTTAIALAKW